MPSYDDAEGMLQDQGLEVVVIPYRPSPPPPPSIRPPRHPHNNDNDDQSVTPQPQQPSQPAVAAAATPATVSPARDESKMQLDDDDGRPTNLFASPPPPPPPHPKTPQPPPPPPPTQVMFTPRTGSVVAEALNQSSVETTPPPPHHHHHHHGPTRNMVSDSRGRSSSCAPRPPPIDAKNAYAPISCNNTKRKSNVCTNNSTPPNTTTAAAATTTTTTTTTTIRSSRSRSSPVTSSYQRKSAISAPDNNNNNNNGATRNNNANNKNNNNNNNQNQNLGLYQMAKAGYQELCNAIIRPPRSTYTMDSLGPEEFTFCGTTIIRKDFGVVNERGLLLECSMWKKKELLDDDDEEEEGAWHDDQQDENDEGVDDDIMDDEDSCNKCRGDNSDETNAIHHHKCGHITLNVDQWDETKERGQMFLHVPESFDIASSSSTLSFSYDDNNNNNEDADERVDGDGENFVPRKGTSHCSSPMEEDEIHHDLHRAKATNHHRQQQQRQHLHSGSMLHNTTCNNHSGRQHPRRRSPVVIYLHGNSSGRTEVISQLGHLLSLGVSIVAFDFAGSGMSEGDYVSLGYYEQEDLKTVIHHLKSSGEVSNIALWGRSMGAATAIMYGSRDPTISCMILDSPFTDLTRLAEEMVEKVKEHGLNVPNFVVSVALRMIKRSVKSQAGFSIRHISPISHVHRCFIPAMFVAGEHDDFIDKQHSKCLHEKYAGDRNLVIVDGDHNSPRPRFLLQSACLFLQSCMQLTPSLELVVPLGTNLQAPPWISNNSMLGNIARAPEASSSLAERRSWLPVNSHLEEQQHQPIPRQRSHPPPLSSTSTTSSSLPPGLPLDNHAMRSRSCADDSYVTASPPATPMLSLPEMSERQVNIQRSLFKMLGRHE